MNVKLVTQRITLMAKSVQNKIQLPIVKHMLQIKIHVLHVMPVIIYQIMLVLKAIYKIVRYTKQIWMNVKLATLIITLMEKTVHYKKLTNVNNMLQIKIHVLHVMPVIIYQIMLVLKAK